MASKEIGYAIGKKDADQTNSYVAGVYSSLTLASDESGERGLYIWRIETQPKGKSRSAKVRRWSDKKNDWVKLHDADDPVKVTREEFGHDPTMEVEEPPVSNDVDFAYFENAVKFDREHLDDALIEHPELVQKVGDRYATAISRRDEAKEAVKQIEGRLYGEIRSELEGKGEKVSEALLAAKINSHPERAKAVARYIKATEVANRWEIMRDSYKDRGYAMNTVANLYGAGYWSNNSAGNSSGRNNWKQSNDEYADNEQRRRQAYAERNQQRSK